MSPEWEKFHDSARNAIESLHQGFKDEGTEQMGAAGRRRVRGLCAAQVFATILLTNYNLRNIALFFYEEKYGKDLPDDPTVRRRDRVWYNPYTRKDYRPKRVDGILI